MKNTEAVNLLHSMVEEYVRKVHELSPAAAYALNDLSREALQLIYLDIMRLNQVVEAIENGIPVTKVPTYDLNRKEDEEKDG